MSDAPPKVLMAEDEPETLEIMARRMRREGFAVVTAADGMEAWEKIRTEDPDVIVLDITMPRLDGLTLLKMLRDDPPTAKWQPVIIVSARAELQDVRAGLDSEADHYLTKPCSVEEIVRAVRLMLHLIPQRRIHREPDSGRGEAG